ncbi:MAG: esterase-like activity of phytase family protein [Planctomycetota bacterium]
MGVFRGMVAGLVLVGAVGASGQSIEKLGAFEVPGLARIGGMAFSGISGIDFDPQSGLGIVVSNDTGTRHPVRFMAVTAVMDSDELVHFAPLRAQALNNPDGSVFAPGLHRPGAVRIIPADPIGDEPYLVWASEGVPGTGEPAGVYEMCTGATHMDGYQLSPYMTALPGSQGPRDDRAYESLALMPDHSLIAATAQPLFQDGPVVMRGAGSGPVRLVHLDYWSASTMHEYVYVLDEPPADAPEGAERSLVELVAINEKELLAIESIMVPGQRRSPRADTELYIVSLENATDVRGVSSLSDGDSAYRPVAKRKLGDSASLGLPDARFAAGTFWHELDDGRQGLLLISDNANDAYRPTHVVGLAVDGLEPVRPFTKAGEREPGVTPGPHRFEPARYGPWVPPSARATANR